MLIGNMIALFVSLVTVTFALGWSGRALLRQKPTSVPRLIPQPVFGTLTGPFADLIPLRAKSREELAKELIAAGNFRRTAVDDFLAKRNSGLILSLVVTALCFGCGLADGREAWVGGAGGLISLLMFAIPRLIVSRQASRRIRQIECGLPDALDMMAMSIAGGLTFEQTFRQIAQQLRRSHTSLAKELEIVARQASMGSVEKSLEAFARRVDLPEVSALCTVMAQSQIHGGRMVDSLEQYASRIRRDRKNRAERAGSTASIKLLLPVVTCLCPPIAVMLVGPAMVDFKDFLNRNRAESPAAVAATPARR